jgi:para-aminobenzoate synthetase component I
MLMPFIQEFRSAKSPWQIYQNLYRASEISFFLDSPQKADHKTYSYIGANPFSKIRINPTNGDGFLKQLRTQLKKYQSKSRHPFFAGGAVGYWGYELAGALNPKLELRHKSLPGIPSLYLGFYKDMIVYDHRLKKYYLVVNRQKEDSKKNIEERFTKLKHYFDMSKSVILSAAKNLVGPDRDPSPLAQDDIFRVMHFRPEITKKKFEGMVKKAKAYISQGDIYQANLSQRFSFEFQGSGLKLYDALRKINPSPFASFLNFGDLKIISSSPERLIQKRGRFCETRPIAGTRPLRHSREGGNPVQDPRLKHSRMTKLKNIAYDLLNNPKERAEHIMLVDLERNDLGRVCDFKSVKVKEMMGIEKYSHVIHIVSSVVGKLSKGKDGLDLIRAMFPGGTITGCPKIRCMEIIDELEPVSRGIYTGSIGYLDFNGDLDLNIVIRTLVLQKNKGHFQVGAGIVYDSNPSKEYEETLHKGEALTEALVRASM